MAESLVDLIQMLGKTGRVFYSVCAVVMRALAEHGMPHLDCICMPFYHMTEVILFTVSA